MFVYVFDNFKQNGVLHHLRVSGVGGGGGVEKQAAIRSTCGIATSAGKHYRFIQK